MNDIKGIEKEIEDRKKIEEQVKIAIAMQITELYKVFNSETEKQLQCLNNSFEEQSHEHRKKIIDFFHNELEKYQENKWNSGILCPKCHDKLMSLRFYGIAEGKSTCKGCGSVWSWKLESNENKIILNVEAFK